jgi:hypothetical protein
MISQTAHKQRELPYSMHANSSGSTATAGLPEWLSQQGEGVYRQNVIVRLQLDCNVTPQGSEHPEGTRPRCSASDYAPLAQRPP